MSKYEKENYLARDATISVWENHANVHILQTYQDLIHGSVLDVGCNHGASGTYWLTKNPNVTSIVAIDVQELPRGAFEKIMADATIPAKYVVTDFSVARVPETLYDTVISFHTLEHIWPDDVSVFIQNVYDHLKLGGHFVISIPYKDSYDDPHHAIEFDESSLSTHCESVGFVTIECMEDNRWKEKNLLTGVFRK